MEKIYDIKKVKDKRNKLLPRQYTEHFFFVVEYTSNAFFWFKTIFVKTEKRRTRENVYDNTLICGFNSFSKSFVRWTQKHSKIFMRVSYTRKHLPYRTCCIVINNKLERRRRRKNIKTFFQNNNNAPQDNLNKQRRTKKLLSFHFMQKSKHRDRVSSMVTHSTYFRVFHFYWSICVSTEYNPIYKWSMYGIEESVMHTNTHWYPKLC